MINSITIQGFRGIESGKVKKMTQFNIFVGSNDSGKSTILEAIYLASAVHPDAKLLVQKNKEWQSYNINLCGQDLLGHHALTSIASKHSDTVESSVLTWIEADPDLIKVKTADPQAPKILQHFQLDMSQGEFLTTKPHQLALFALDFKPENQDLVQIINNSQEPLVEPNRTVFCWYPDLTYYGKGTATWQIEGQPPAAEHTFFCDTSMVQSYIPIAFYRRVLNQVPGWTQRIARHFGKIFEIEDPFTVQFVPVAGSPERLQGWIAWEDKPALSIDAFGDGARAAFKLLVPLVVMAEMATPDAPGLLLWEEPEAFQNPKTLGNLLAEVAKIIRDKPIQVFISTHNLELVAYVAQMMESKELDPETTMLFHLSLSDGKLKSSWFDQETLITWLDSGIDPRAWKDFIPPLQFQLQEK